MAKDEEDTAVESEVWNQAKGFSTYHVLIPLIESRKLVKVCLFGVEEIGQEYSYPEQVLIKNKINAINRLLQELQQIIQDNEFIMDKSTKENHLDKVEKKLEAVAEVIDGISHIEIDARIGEVRTVLNQKHYNLCLMELRLALSDIKKPLNMKNLIFPAGDDFDLEAWKREMIDGY